MNDDSVSMEDFTERSKKGFPCVVRKLPIKQLWKEHSELRIKTFQLL